MVKTLKKLIINNEEYLLVADVTPGSVGHEQIADQAVMAHNIGDYQVCERHLDGVLFNLINGALHEIPEKSVGSDSLIEGSVAFIHLAPELHAVINDLMNNAGQVADGAVTSPKIAQYAVCNEHLDGGAVTGDKMPPKTIPGDRLEDGAVGFDQLSGDVQAAINGIGELASSAYSRTQELEAGLQTILDALNAALGEEVTA